MNPSPSFSRDTSRAHAVRAAGRSADLAITGACIVTCDADRSVLDPGTVLIRDGRILDIVTGRFRAGSTVDASGMLLLPGFVDAHVHCLPLLLRGLSQDCRLAEWLAQVVYPGLAAYTAADARLAARLFCAEALRSGITTLGDSTDLAYRPELVAATLGAFRDAGLRAVFFRTFSDAPPPDLELNREPVERVLADVARLKRHWERRLKGQPSRIRIGVGINEVALVTAEAWIRATQFARDHDMPMMAHCAESRADASIQGKPVVVWLEERGLLHNRLQLNHGVHLSGRDAAILARHGTALSWQPSTNAILCDGIAPARAMVRAGVPVAVGTDDANLNDTVNMFSELRTASLVAKLRERRPDAVASETLLEMATIQAARTLGWDREIGSIEPGKWADLQTIDRTALAPLAHLPSALVYQAAPSHVRSVWVAGCPVVEQGRVLTLNEDVLRAEAGPAAARIRQRSGLQRRLADRWWGTFGLDGLG